MLQSRCVVFGRLFYVLYIAMFAKNSIYLFSIGNVNLDLNTPSIALSDLKPVPFSVSWPR
jgi:hypothetical protein